MRTREGALLGLAFFVLASGCGPRKLAGENAGTDGAAGATPDAPDAPIEEPADAAVDEGADEAASLPPPHYVQPGYPDAGRPLRVSDTCLPDGDKTSLKNFGCNCTYGICDGSDLACDTSATIGGVTYTRHCWCDGQFIRCCDTPAAYYECVVCPSDPPTVGTPCRAEGSCRYSSLCPDVYYCDVDHTWRSLVSSGGTCPTTPVEAGVPPETPSDAGASD